MANIFEEGHKTFVRHLVNFILDAKIKKYDSQVTSFGLGITQAEPIYFI